MKLGMLTIGQSPRVDVIPEIRDLVGLDVEIVEKGALDGLNLEEVEKFYPEKDDYGLITRMEDGTEVKVAERHIIERIKKCISDFEEEAVDVILLLCTGEFPDVESKKIVLQTNKIILHTTISILNKGKLGVIVPSADQIPEVEAKWKGAGFEVVTEVVSPYRGTDEEVKEKANKIKAFDVDLVVLDCIGYNRKIKAMFREITEKPVLLPRTAMGRIVGEIMEA